MRGGFSRFFANSVKRPHLRDHTRRRLRERHIGVLLLRRHCLVELACEGAHGDDVRVGSLGTTFHPPTPAIHVVVVIQQIQVVLEDVVGSLRAANQVTLESQQDRRYRSPHPPTQTGVALVARQVEVCHNHRLWRRESLQRQVIQLLCVAVDRSQVVENLRSTRVSTPTEVVIALTVASPFIGYLSRPSRNPRPGSAGSSPAPAA